jgi:hypothetical protein
MQALRLEEVGNGVGGVLAQEQHQRLPARGAVGGVGGGEGGLCVGRRVGWWACGRVGVWVRRKGMFWLCGVCPPPMPKAACPPHAIPPGRTCRATT